MNNRLVRYAGCLCRLEMLHACEVNFRNLGMTLLVLTGTAFAGPMIEMNPAELMPPQMQVNAVAYHNHHEWRHGWHYGWYRNKYHRYAW